MRAINCLMAFGCLGLWYGSSLAASDESLCGAEKEIASCSIHKEGLMVSLCAKPTGEVAYYEADSSGIHKRYIFSSDLPLYRWLDKSYTTYFGFDDQGKSHILAVPEERFGAKAFLIEKEAGINIGLGIFKTCDANSFGEKDLKNPVIVEVPDDFMSQSESIFPPGYYPRR